MNQQLITLAINLSVFLTFLIFCALLSLPLKLFFQTKYETHKAKNINVIQQDADHKEVNSTINFRQLKICPYEYEHLLRSSYLSNFDKNCIIIQKPKEDKVVENVVDNVPNTPKCIVDNVDKFINESKEGIQKNKSVPVVGHILATMLIVSVVVALVEVLKIRLFKNKETPVRRNIILRKECSIDINFPSKRFSSREPVKSQLSFELQGINKSSLRLLGARPPPLIRRSSFPTQIFKDTITCTEGTSINRSSRALSVDCDDEISGLIIALHRRTHLIRRH